MKYPLALTAFLCFCTELSAQQKIDSIQQLQHVEIAAERIETSFSQSARSISMISAQEIAQLPVQNVAEVLTYVPGVDIRQRGPQGVQADVGIRGGAFDQTLILINGVRMSDPQTGHHVMNLVVQPELIERIEVLKGPGTRIYGPNAFAGAINIITKSPDKKGLSANLSGGQHGLYHTHLAVHMPVGKWKQTLSGGLSGSEGYRFNTDFSMGNLFYQGGLHWGAHKLQLMAGYNQRAFGANGFYANENFSDQYEETNTLVTAISWQYAVDSFKSDVRVYHRRHEDDYFFLRHQPDFFHNHHISNSSGMEWQASKTHTYGISGWGAELRQEQIISSNLGNHQRSWFGLFADHRFSGKKWQLTPGIYLNAISELGWRAYPGIDLAFFPVKGLNFYANAGQSFRLPTYTDLYYVGPANLGNPELLPEQAWTYELGSRYFYKSWMWSSAFFVRDANRLIEWVRADMVSPWQANNFIEVVSKGIETEWQWRSQKGVFRQIRLGYTYIESGFSVMPGFESRYVLENLRHQFQSNVVMAFGDKNRLTLGLRAFERVNRAETFAIADLQAEHDLHKKGSIYLQATNFFNTPYREIGTVPMPGRWLRIGLRFRI
ncbi:MAG: TonB-dependent receptor plug domain-containing protein [Bacteroidia bacterium]